MERKFTVKEMVEAISGLSYIDRYAVFDILNGKVTIWTKECIDAFDISESRCPTLIKAIANWNLDFPAHKDDAILTLLEELLEDVLCQQQPGKEKTP